MLKLILSFFFGLLCLTSLIAHPGIGIVMDSKGNVFYTDLEHVWKITPDGQRTIAVEKVHTHELYLDEDDNLYGEHEWYEGEATDKWGNYVWCLSNSGMLEESIPPVEGFLDNSTLIRDDNGNSYYSKKTDNYEVLMQELTNGQYNTLSAHHFKDIRWMYFSKTSQSIYVVDYLKLKKVTLDGGVTLVTDNLKENGASHAGIADRHYVFGVWTDKNENVYVAVYGAGKVKKIDLDGNISTVFESPIGWSPSGGLMADNGDMYIMEFSIRNKTRVRRISANGEQTIFGG